MKTYTVGVIGNPNCGKTTLFNVLTGSKQRVGNWAGVTVEKKTGFYQYQTQEIELVDLPGIYSIDGAQQHTAIDESIAQEYLLSGEADLIINILDASNLERNLYLTTQLLEMKVPFIVVLNMMDNVVAKGDQIDIEQLSKLLGVPVIPCSATQRQGIDTLKKQIYHSNTQKTLSNTIIEYPNVIETALQKITPLIKSFLAVEHQTYYRWFSLRLLENVENHPNVLPEDLKQLVEQQQQIIVKELEEDIDVLIADVRYQFINQITQQAHQKSGQVSRSLSDKIDHIVLNRILGIPIFLAMMYLMFLFTVNIGGAFIDFFDLLFAAFLVDGLSVLLEHYGVSEWLVTLLAQGVGGGVQVIATFIPVITSLYLFLSILEDSGYMARAAFVMDRFMRFIGLPGKSFVPLIVGFGCNVPAIMATRTLENRRDRYLTILMNPFISCGARLPVYALFTTAFFPSGGQNIIFILYLIGIIVAILTGLIMKHTLLKGNVTHFVMELPAYHIPTFRNISLHTWERLKSFVLRAGKIIIPMVILISFLNAWGTDGSFNKENSNESILSEVGKMMTPAFAPMGIKEDNWVAVVGIFTGVLAKEVVVGTLNTIYAQQANLNSETKEDFNLVESIQAAFATIPENLINVFGHLTDPLGFQDAEQEIKETDSAVINMLLQKFDGAIGAFAYLLFILMYFPCVAAIAAIYRETNLKWALFVAIWTTGIAYTCATLFYQVAHYFENPSLAIFWGMSLLMSFMLAIFCLYFIGRRSNLLLT